MVYSRFNIGTAIQYEVIQHSSYPIFPTPISD
jgi:hypothetical protein